MNESALKLNFNINETNVLTNFHDDWAKIVSSRVFTRKTAPFTGGHVFQRTGLILELNQHIMFTCFHYIHIEKNAPPTDGHVFSLIWTIFELVRDINKTNNSTNFHDDWANIVTFRVFTSFDLDRDIIGTKLLTKFHEDRTIHVASRVFTNKCGRMDGQRTKIGHKSSPEHSLGTRILTERP
ncbi:hypothetical protein DPMN_110124 [Dreissena polymorpha]|uniref:Uncharacterized protein n=1 Tax=Dreissena polymorpha TaxID=45954 RepID=A0A9D4KC99_DREPO|nr:hypothetical protein DPMN_152555 [Dreissena polymorpha]KAH3836749.1 hypothetical protein DPMN_110124 [Dreissena polymorpha]